MIRKIFQEVNEILRNIKSCLMPIVLSLLHWLLSVSYVFGASLLTTERITKSFILINIIYVLLVLITYKYIFFVYSQYKIGVSEYRRGVHIFLTFFLIFTLLLIILWPGTWAWDDIVVVNNAHNFIIFGWQHVLSSIFHILCLQFLPFPAGIIFIQNIHKNILT